MLGAILVGIAALLEIVYVATGGTSSSNATRYRNAFWIHPVVILLICVALFLGVDPVLARA
jgi:hypothetical protein